MGPEQSETVEAIVAAVRQGVGKEVQLMIEVHGRLSVEHAIAMGRRLARYEPAWYEEPVTPNSLDLLGQVKQALPFSIAAGERLYTLEDFYRLTKTRACDVVQMDLAHCGGLGVGKKIAAMAEVQDLGVAPHVSIGPVALCAALHFDWSTPNFLIQENFAEYDVSWRNDLVQGWNPVQNGEFLLPTGPGLGIELDTTVCEAHPYKENSFPSLWDAQWVQGFAQDQRERQD